MCFFLNPCVYDSFMFDYLLLSLDFTTLYLCVDSFIYLISLSFQFCLFLKFRTHFCNLLFDPLKRKTRGEEAQERTRRIDQTKVAVTGGAPHYQHHPRGDSSTTPKKDGTRAPPNRGKRENQHHPGEREG